MYQSLISLSVVFLAASCVISSPLSYTSPHTSNGSVVDLGYAKYQASTNGLGVDEFLGMRFAAPPLGDLRFRAPRDPKNETDIIKADAVSGLLWKRWKHGN